MANDRVILELVLAGRSYSEIVAVVGCSRRGGSRVRQMVTERGLSSAAANDLFAVLANHARTIDLGQFDMRKLRQEQTRADKQYWE